MNDQTMKTNTTATSAEINIRRLVDAVLHRLWAVVLAAILGTVLVFFGTRLLVTPQYEASAMFYVNNNSISVGDASLSISSADITASKSLVDTYIVILNTRATLVDVIDYAGVNISYGELSQMIRAEAVNDTEVFEVVVTHPDPQEAEKIANAIGYILPKRISSIIESTSAKIVESAIVPAKPSSPDYTMNAVIGFLLGLVLSAGVIILRELMDVTIRTEEDIAQITFLPVLSEIPDMAAPTRSSGYYSRSKKKGAGEQSKQAEVIGEGISFASAEAYKLLRTKLQFSFADDEERCRVICLSSALSGEGKSLTAINLAFTLSQLSKKVILIDCDMRRPTVAEKLKIEPKPGLSSYLSGQMHLDGLVQYCGIKSDEKAFHVITAGEAPPNPVELLSSNRMKKLLAVLREHYHYVILDMPPVGEVSDAMAVTRDVDGMLLVVRQNHCNRIVLREAMRQFEYVNTRILGVVFNCTSEIGGLQGYGKKYYSRYYRRYYGYGKNRRSYYYHPGSQPADGGKKAADKKK